MRKVTIEVISGLLIFLFAYAAISKLSTYNLFKFQLGKSPYIDSYASVVAWLLPLTELAIVALLVIKKTRFLGLYASFFLMLLLTIYIYALLHFSNDVPCSCGGVIAHLTWSQHLAFNLVFTFLALAAILIDISETKGSSYTVPQKEFFAKKGNEAEHP